MRWLDALANPPKTYNVVDTTTSGIGRRDAVYIEGVWHRWEDGRIIEPTHWRPYFSQEEIAR